MRVDGSTDCRTPESGSKPVRADDSVPAGTRVQRRLSPERLEARRRDAADLQAAIDLAGSSRSAVARAVGVSSSAVDDWCDSFADLAVTSADIDLMPREVRAAYHESKLRGARPEPAALVRPELAVLRAGGEGGEAMSSVHAALLDGRMTKDEAAVALREALDARDAWDRVVDALRTVAEGESR